MSSRLDFEWESVDPAVSVEPDLSDPSASDLRWSYERERERVLALVTLLERVEEAREAGPTAAPAMMDLANGALALSFQRSEPDPASGPSSEIYSEILIDAQKELEALDALLRMAR